MSTLNLGIIEVAARTMTTSKGKSVTSVLSDDDALDLVGEIRFQQSSNFADDIYRACFNRRATDNQWVWLHVIAMGEYNRRNPVVAPSSPESSSATNYDAIAGLFRIAIANSKAGVSKLSITIVINGIQIRVKLAGPRSKYAGKLFVTDSLPFGEGTLYGVIDTDNGAFEARKASNAVLNALTMLNADPVKMIAEYGKRTNQCCFCGRALTDDRTGSSVELGYGPICKIRYNLPGRAK